MWRPCSTSGLGFPPPAQGLYDPRTEHDACGVGFVVHMKGQRSHDIVRKALQVLINLEHRGACGCEANTGDGAGILIQMPDAFLRKVVLVHAAGRRAATAPGSCSCRTTSATATHQGADRAIVDEEGQTLLGWRDVPTDNSLVGDSARATQPVFEQVFIGAPRRRRPTTGRARFERKLYVIRKRIEHAVDALKINALSRRFFYIVSLSAQHADLQGHAAGAAARADVPGPVGRAICSRRSRSCTSASAPTRSRRGRWRTRTARRAQRRDQHAARQHQLDARARGAAPERSVRRRPEEAPADHPRGRQRHGDLRQRARAAGDGRPLAAARAC